MPPGDSLAQKLNSKDFWTLSQQTLYRDRFIELIDGEIVEMPSSLRASQLALLIGSMILPFVREHQLGYVTTADGGYVINDENVFAPDVGFISKERLPELPAQGFGPIPPDLAIEVVSPSDLKDRKQRIEAKLERYLRARVPMICYVYMERKVVEVHRPDRPLQIIGLEDELDLSEVIPGLRLKLRDIFED
jgi:Uma2 family endonuclease